MLNNVNRSVFASSSTEGLLLVYEERGHDMEGKETYLWKGQALGPERNQREKYRLFQYVRKSDRLGPKGQDWQS